MAQQPSCIEFDPNELDAAWVALRRDFAVLAESLQAKGLIKTEMDLAQMCVEYIAEQRRKLPHAQDA